ncbi:hypothetical protein NE237_026904 [Protea cynaroides]|uniref:Uncharacterized protein n=1 Tax=Protea cynaroides TaxID=273540 RepID=A0A9Q0JSP2_9MAGN|nr:hypothetical protein NE237_026904 [Protea cynaroides]
MGVGRKAGDKGSGITVGEAMVKWVVRVEEEEDRQKACSIRPSMAVTLTTNSLRAVCRESNFSPWSVAVSPQSFDGIIQVNDILSNPSSIQIQPLTFSSIEPICPHLYSGPILPPPSFDPMWIAILRSPHGSISDEDERSVDSRSSNSRHLDLAPLASIHDCSLFVEEGEDDYRSSDEER